MEGERKAFDCVDAEIRVSVLRMEIDYELLCLHDALLDKDLQRVEVSKQRLQALHKEMYFLETCEAAVY